MWSTIGIILVLAHGWYGGLAAIRFWRDSGSRASIFHPLGGGIYVATGVLCFFFMLLAAKAGAASVLEALPYAVMMPVLLLPYGLYFAAVCVAMGSEFFASGTSGEVRTYDRGDAAMARKDYAAAIFSYRADLTHWPDDVDATLRLARAHEANAQPEAAAAELNALRLEMLERGPREADAAASASEIDPAVLRRNHYERVLTLTYAQGDLYEGPLHEPERARRLYEETLQRLFGFPQADPLRARIKRLEDRLAGRDEISSEQAEEASGKLSLD